jgi:hypothetical protein
LQSALIEAEKANEDNNLRRGCWVDRAELMGLVQVVENDAFDVAVGHLGLDRGTAKPDWSIQALYNEAGRPIPEYWR